MTNLSKFPIFANTVPSVSFNWLGRLLETHFLHVKETIPLKNGRESLKHPFFKIGKSI